MTLICPFIGLQLLRIREEGRRPVAQSGSSSIKKGNFVKLDVG